LLDVMGHGISSSLVGMYISSVLKDTIVNYIDPVEVITELNRRMNQLDIKDPFIQYYFTAIYVMVDTNEKLIEYINAGHPPGLVQANGQLYELSKGCCAVGLFPEMSMEKGSIQYHTSMNILLYTDGFLEQLKIQDDKGMKKMIDMWLSCNEPDADTLFDKCIREDSLESQHDDICLIRIHANSNEMNRVEV
jgi:sigma-B regulation protein RsbU (phosphoserine phosphatase)